MPVIIRNALKIGSDEEQIAKRDYREMVEEIKQQFIPQAQSSKSKWWYRAQLHQRRQKFKESIQEYKSALLTLARNAELHYHHDITLTMAFISGLKNKSIRKCLQDIQEELTFAKAIDLAIELETETQAEKTTDNTDQNADHPITNAESNNEDSNPNHDTVKSNNRPQQGRRYNRNSKLKKSCYRCGSYSHLAANCAYKQLICNWCERKGHIARECYDKRDYEYYEYYD